MYYRYFKVDIEELFRTNFCKHRCSEFTIWTFALWVLNTAYENPNSILKITKFLCDKRSILANLGTGEVEKNLSAYAL